VLFEGQEISPKRLTSDKPLQRHFRQRVCLLFQNPDAMIFNPTVYDEIAFGLRQLQVSQLDERVRYWADQVGVSALLTRSPFSLSGGEKQKICLASLLALEPKVLLMDEPTSAMDPRATGWLVDFLAHLSMTTITTTHNLSLAPELGTRTLVLSEDHRLIYDGDMAPLFADLSILTQANLVHTHRHAHGEQVHAHVHIHDWV
jgi:cobalt/nickel transport system ATP-binding protein